MLFLGRRNFGRHSPMIILSFCSTELVIIMCNLCNMLSSSMTEVALKSEMYRPSLPLSFVNYLNKEKIVDNSIIEITGGSNMQVDRRCSHSLMLPQFTRPCYGIHLGTDCIGYSLAYIYCFSTNLYRKHDFLFNRTSPILQAFVNLLQDV